MKEYIGQKSGSFIIGIALIISVIIGGLFYVNKSSTGNTLTVTGSAKMSVTSDKVIWRTSITRNVSTENLRLGYSQIAADLKLVETFLNQSGIPQTAIIISPVTAMQDWNQDGGAPRTYTLRQSLEINSDDVNGITALSKNIQRIVDQVPLFQTDSIEYLYSKLNESRVSLLTDATTDAKARAHAMAQASNQSAGKLQSASSGVVQVLSRGAIDNGEYGQYDTSKIEKDITVTVRATFSLQ